uniref:Uncharacterized protein n=1 Tax=viral metagenome TaxID=1070528 RepID=A0A6C0D4D2_9ZZZZ
MKTRKLRRYKKSLGGTNEKEREIIEEAKTNIVKNKEEIVNTNNGIIKSFTDENIKNLSFDEKQYDTIDTTIKRNLLKSHNKQLISNYIRETVNNRLKNETTKKALRYSFGEQKKEWSKVCNRGVIFKKECGETLKDIITREIESTIYMLRLIFKSIISIENTIESSNIFILNDKDAKLTGLWKDDSQFINLNITQYKPRLIMGFGPSASGKTYNATQIINIFTQLDKDFPKVFLSIDGGIAREQSMAYQTIVYDLLSEGVLGLSGLVTGIQTFSIFNSDKVKKQLISYLASQTNKMSLYVPETLGSCLHVGFSPFDCRPKYKKYIDYTGDNQWIGLNIWQHKEGGNCTFADEFKCEGCKESGEKREIKEGKKYSGSQWQTSYNNGQREMLTAVGGRYEIHNTGGKKTNGILNKNTFIDHTNYSKEDDRRELEKKIKEIGWRYCNNSLANCSTGNESVNIVKYDTNHVVFIKDILDKMFL